MLRFIKTMAVKHSLYMIGIPSLLWLAIFVVPNHWLGKDYTISNFLLFYLFPIIGGGYLFLFAVSQKIRYLIFGLIFIFSFFITMFIGYLLLGVWLTYKRLETKSEMRVYSNLKLTFRVFDQYTLGWINEFKYFLSTKNVERFFISLFFLWNKV